MHNGDEKNGGIDVMRFGCNLRYMYNMKPRQNGFT